MMKKSLNIAVGSMHTFAHDVIHNKQLIIELVHEAHQKQAQLLLLPELCLSGYGVEDLFFSERYVNSMLPLLLAFTHEIPEELLVVVGLPILVEGKRYNAAALLKHKEIIGIVCKQHLALSGIHYEPRWFSAWPKDKRMTLTVKDREIPVGDLLFEIDGVTVGFEICEDAWVENRVGLAHHQKGVDVILNPSASHFAIGKQKRRQEMVHQASKQFECLYVYSNLLGCETGRAVYDGVNIISHKGKALLETTPFSFKESTLDVLSCELTPKPSDKKHKDNINVDFSWVLKPLKNSTKNIPAPLSDNEAACLAIARGLWDWQLKTKTTGFLVSLSGGADSALSASLVSLAHWMGYHALGKKAYLNEIKQCGVKMDDLNKEGNSLDQLMPLILKTVYQGSKNSSFTTKNAASALANALHASHVDWTIDDMVDDYIKRAETVYQKPLTWEDNDIALQNIQARVRSPGVWLLANIENKLLLATSNLSEAVVGYCTMDGDTAGVLAPIGGVSKTRVLALNRFLMEKGITYQDKQFALPALIHIVKQAPTAELRPTTQTDEADLMPYEVLDAIRVLAQVDFLSPDTILSKLVSMPFESSYNETQLTGWRDRYFELYYRNQWKRERLAPSFHIEIDSACPKTYRRFPII